MFADRPERIAIYGSGGMSHDPDGPRAGWIDQPLDNWVFERIERNRSEELTRLFSFDSDTLRGGTGDDTYVVATGDVLIENAGEGTECALDARVGTESLTEWSAHGEHEQDEGD